MASAPDMGAPVGPEANDNQLDPDGQLFAKLKAWVLSARDHLADWRKEAEEAYDFYNGRQWTDDERALFEADGRVAPIFNLTAINVDAVCGLEVNNRQDVKYLPRTAGDVQVNEFLSDAAMWIRDQAQSEDEESDSFRDVVVTGLGVTETRVNGEDITVDRRDPREGFYDPSAKKPNLIDRRFGGRIVMYDTDEALAMFPGQTVQTLNAKWASTASKGQGENVERLDYPTSQGPMAVGDRDYRPKKVCLVEIEWIDFEGGQRVKRQAFLGQTAVLEVNPLSEWAYNFITGKRDQKKNTWYGIVRALRDPQKLINKYLATVTHIMATNAKGGLIYEDGVFKDERDAERNWSNPQKNVKVIQGALQRNAIQPRVAPPLPPGMVEMIQFAVGNIRNISGINVELLGAADRDQPASLELQRKQSAVTILAALFDSKRRYHKEQGKTLLALMRALPPETLVRVTVDQPPPMQPPELPPGTSPEAAQQAMAQFEQAHAAQQQQAKREMFVTLQMIGKALSDPTIRFDVIVDEAPSSPNQQQEIATRIFQLAQQGVALPPQAQAILVKSIGLPTTVADPLAEALGGAPDAKTQQLTQALQSAQQEAAQNRDELAGVKADRALELSRTQIDNYRAQTERMKVNGESVAKTGGLPNADGPPTPVAEALIQLKQQLDQIGQAVLHLQGAA